MQVSKSYSAKNSLKDASSSLAVVKSPVVFFHAKDFVTQLNEMPVGELNRRALSSQNNLKVPQEISPYVTVRNFVNFDKLIREKPILLMFYYSPLKDPNEMLDVLLNNFIRTKICSESVILAWAKFRSSDQEKSQRQSMTARQRWLDAANIFALA